MGEPGKNGNLPAEKDLRLFYEVANSIHEIRDLDEMLKSIMNTIKTVFRAEGASVALHDPEHGEFYFIRTVEESQEGNHSRMKYMRFPDHLGIGGWVLRERRSVLIPDVAKDPRFYGGMDRQESFTTRSMICVPLITHDRFLGLLYVLNRLEGEFTDRDLKLLETLSGSIAIAIENARLYGELRQYAGSLEQENLRLKAEVQARFNLHGIVGSSPAIRGVFSLLEKVIDTSITVLIQGETGTGKELFARVLHYNSPRKEKPFVAENCGALSEHLLESELFGHVRGAFTGAVGEKKGLFELADRGTAFLDEVGEMSPAMQIKLLRVLQEGEVRPVGGSECRRVDVRVIASTNRNLEAEVKRGRFREDLFYRLHVFPIRIPPLRERREDIPLLAEHFLERYAKKHGRPQTGFTPQAMDLLCRHGWEGNVRELENEVERAVALAREEKRIGAQLLSERIRLAVEKDPAVAGVSGTMREAVERLEQQMIRECLKRSGGNRSRAARLLGLTRQGLLNKLARYRIEP